MYCQDEIATQNICLILSNETDGTIHNYPCTVPFLTASRQLRLNQALDDTCHRVMPLYGAQLFHVDFANRINRFLGVYPFQNQVKINTQSVVNGSVQIILKPGQNRTTNQMMQQDIATNQPKTKKVKERTIKQAFQSVKLWRKLYDTDDGNGKRQYTLDEAARIVGIAKKTLDDYYSLIRTAINFSFNLQKFKQSKVGLLRKFVKIAKDQGQQGINAKMAIYTYENIDKYMVDLSDL